MGREYLSLEGEGSVRAFTNGAFQNDKNILAQGNSQVEGKG